MKDPIFSLIDEEFTRQKQGAEVIASENYVSESVLQAAGSILTNKYAEGYPKKRYYGGCECVDKIEQIAIDRAKELFQAEYVNVQPHSGSSANFAVYTGLLEPGDKIMGMALSSGGHLTHGHHVNASGIFFESHPYIVGDDGYLDYDLIEKQAKEIQPKILVCGFTAYPRDFDYERFRKIADSVGAYLMADIAHIAGLVASGVFKNPLDICDVVTTTTHKTLRGPRGGMIMTNNVDVYKKIQKAIFPGIQGGPLEHVIAAKAIAFQEALQPEFRLYAEQIVKNMQAIVKVFTDEGIKMVTGGSDNHLIVADLRSVGIDGTIGETVLGACDITCNKNTVPDETGSAFNPSGIRIGTAAITTRGLKEEDATWLAKIMVQALKNADNLELHEKLKKEVNEKMNTYPLFGW